MRELTEVMHWVVWRSEANADGNMTKVPYQPHRPHLRASSTRPIEWSDYETAIGVPEVTGVGFVVTGDFVGIDLDHCLNGGIKPWARDLVDRFQSYTEVTPSLDGLRIWVRGAWNGSWNRYAIGGGRVEVYGDKRFFTVTGDWCRSGAIEERQSLLDELAAERHTTLATQQVIVNTQADVDDCEVLEKLSGRPGFNSLWTGDLGNHEADHSRADLALCSMIAMYTQDVSQIERIFGLSALARRHKWSRPSYRERTIKKALS